QVIAAALKPIMLYVCLLCRCGIAFILPTYCHDVKFVNPLASNT
ncbi:MAG: hypothetical protein ACI8QG_002552, partial [Flavobacteriales bacterium]